MDKRESVLDGIAIGSWRDNKVVVKSDAFTSIVGSEEKEYLTNSFIELWSLYHEDKMAQVVLDTFVQKLVREIGGFTQSPIMSAKDAKTFVGKLTDFPSQVDITQPENPISVQRVASLLLHYFGTPAVAVTALNMRFLKEPRFRFDLSYDQKLRMAAAMEAMDHLSYIVFQSNTAMSSPEYKDGELLVDDWSAGRILKIGELVKTLIKANAFDMLFVPISQLDIVADSAFWEEGPPGDGGEWIFGYLSSIIYWVQLKLFSALLGVDIPEKVDAEKLGKFEAGRLIDQMINETYHFETFFPKNGQPTRAMVRRFLKAASESSSVNKDLIHNSHLPEIAESMNTSGNAAEVVVAESIKQFLQQVPDTTELAKVIQGGEDSSSQKRQRLGCEVCGQDAQYKCSVCNGPAYCSDVCAKNHWSNSHAQECQK